MADRERLRQRINERYGSAYKFAKVAGYSKQWISYLLTGKYDISPHMCQLMAKLLDIPECEYPEFFGGTNGRDENYTTRGKR